MPRESTSRIRGRDRGIQESRTDDHLALGGPLHQLSKRYSAAPETHGFGRYSRLAAERAGGIRGRGKETSETGRSYLPGFLGATS